MITPFNAAFPFSTERERITVSPSLLLLIFFSPAVAYAIAWLIELRNPVVDLVLLLLTVVAAYGHTIPTFFILTEKPHLKFMSERWIKYYVLPGLLIAAFAWTLITHYALGFSLFALANSYHIGMQNHGILRLIDQRLGIPYQWRLVWSEKIFLTLSSTLLLLIRFFSLGMSVEITVFVLSVLFLITVVETFIAVKDPKTVFLRSALLLSGSLFTLPFFFVKAPGRFELIYLPANFGHALQYFICLRFYFSLSSFGTFPEMRPRLQRRYLALLVTIGALTLTCWMRVSYRLYLEVVIWVPAFIHIVYDALVWHSTVPHFRDSTMATLKEGLALQPKWEVVRVS